MIDMAGILDAQYRRAVIEGDVDKQASIEAEFAGHDAAVIAQLTGPMAIPTWVKHYIGMGIAVFPLQPATKLPFPNSGGFKDASTDPERVRLMFQRAYTLSGNRWPNIGAATGTESGGTYTFDVVDIDGGNALYDFMGGDNTVDNGSSPYAAIRPQVIGWGLTQRWEAGHHIFVPAVEGRRNQANVGGSRIDIRATGGYVVLPPSVGETGKLWRWLRPLTPDRQPYFA